MQTAQPLVPDSGGLAALRDAAAVCTACPLHETGTQTVFGAGPARARLVVVGEQPGDQEDRDGEPFVGPAGRELDRALDAVGIDRDEVYVTNTVKHFKWSERRGKRRIHERPNTLEIRACFPWLQAELRVTRPDVVLALGSTAAQAIIARDFKVTRQRGQLRVGPEGTVVTATVHPSSILRSRGEQDRHRAREAFHDDLAVIASILRDGLEAGLAHQTKRSLYGVAQVLQVEGRSSLDKGGLVAAVADAMRAG